MAKATIKGYFNPRHEGDTFKGLGLHMGIDGEIADQIYPDLPGFLAAANRNYYIKKVPAGVLDPNGAVDANGNVVPGWIEVENQYHLARSNDHRVVSPGTVTDQYAPLSLMDMADELQPWCDAGWCTPDGVYSGKNETLELLTLRLDAGGDLPDGEKFLHYIVFTNPHGKGGKATGKIISFRVVCANTFAAAVSARHDFTITHRVSGKLTPEEQQAKMQSRAKEAVAAWEKAKQHISDLADRINVWNGAAMTFPQAEQLTDKLLGIGDLDKAKTRTKNRRDAILQAFSMPQYGTNGRTAWDWLNGVTFVNSSPNAASVQKSRVTPLDRAIRNVTTEGTGFKLEKAARDLVADFIG